jgi:hypothetical protein
MHLGCSVISKCNFQFFLVSFDRVTLLLLTSGKGAKNLCIFSLRTNSFSKIIHQLLPNWVTDPQYRTFWSAPNVHTTQKTDSNKLLVMAGLPLAQSASLRPTTPLCHGRHQKTNKFGSATKESVLPPKNQQQKLHWHHERHVNFALAPPPYILSIYPGRRRVTLAHCKHSPFGGGGEWLGSTPISTLSFFD